uniref:chitinase n=1 Tax=Leersia perrieri TaxID=77586 RepID=A0A0D9WUA9_9ORYZ
MVIMAMAAVAVHGQQCGSQAGGAVCPNCLCCSKFGWCGSTSDYCGAGCQSQFSSCGSCGGDVTSIVSRSLFDKMLLHRNDAACLAKNFYTYDAFVAAANSFPSFAATGDADTLKREVAAFLAQTRKDGKTGPDYCTQSSQWPCAAGKKYYGRGPIQITHNYNYGPAGKAIGADLLSNPDLVATDATVSFKTAFWFWMTPQSPKPSCHAVITGQWTPSSGDQAAGRVPGFGVITMECNGRDPAKVADRIGFYKRYCDILGVSYGANLDCYNQRPYAVTGRLVNPTSTTRATQ